MSKPTIDVLAHRFRNQKLARPAAESAAAIVAWHGAMQSQDYTGAKWGIGLRARGLTDADVERAFDEGRILRTHVMRPTWHFVAPADIRWLLALTAPRVRSLMAYYDRRLELDAALLKRSWTIFERALGGNRALTRTELAAALKRSGIEAAGQRLGHLVMHAELSAIICSGPRRGKQFTYALVAERVPPMPELTRDEALGTLAARYFASHGPATARDFAWWSGLTLRDVKRGIAIAQPSLAEHAIDGLTYWHLPTSGAVPHPASTAFLLPNYDEFLIAYKDRGLVFDRSTPAPRAGAAEDPHHVLIDGRLRGSWKRTIGAKSALISVRPYRSLSSGERDAIALEGQRLGRFLGIPTTVSYTSIARSSAPALRQAR